MKPSPFGKLFLRFKIPLILMAIILLAVIVYLAIQFPLTHMCTLMGCWDSLELTLVEEPTQDYTIHITTSSGETRNVTCIPGESGAHYPVSTSTPVICNDGKVTFMDFAPQEVTIEIRWQGGSYSVTGQPEYVRFRPNGPDCPPECKRGKLTMELP